MLLISKDEAKYLREHGRAYDVHMTKSKHPKYYLTESFKSMKTLEKYRKDKTISSFA